jgi:two-component sensor histidine kinase
VLDVAGVSLDVDAAIPCALIINETVSNAFKYAFPNEREGEIRISLARDGNVIRMTISDNGVGLPDGMTFGASESLGLQLVHSLTDQLGGTVQLSTENGTRFEIQFPYDR